MAGIGNAEYIHGSDSAGLTLTTDYQNGNTMGVGGTSNVTLYINYTPGTNAAVLTINPQVSPDGGTTWYDFTLTTDGTASSGRRARELDAQDLTLTGISAGTAYNRRITLDLADWGLVRSRIQFRARAKESSVATAGVVKVVGVQFDVKSC